MKKLSSRKWFLNFLSPSRDQYTTLFGRGYTVVILNVVKNLGDVDLAFAPSTLRSSLLSSE